MRERPEQIKKHIAALTEFETKYGEYIRVHEEDWDASIAAGAIGAPDNLGSDMPAEDFARLTREVKMLATRADRAIKASGVAPLAGSADLPTQAFDFEVNDGYFSDDGLGVPRELLDRIPSQISGLEIKLEEAKERAETAKPEVKAATTHQPRSAESRHWPTVLTGRIRHVPPFIGFVADVGGFVVVVGFFGRVAGVW